MWIDPEAAKKLATLWTETLTGFARNVAAVLPAGLAGDPQRMLAQWEGVSGELAGISPSSPTPHSRSIFGR